MKGKGQEEGGERKNVRMDKCREVNGKSAEGKGEDAKGEENTK